MDKLISYGMAAIIIATAAIGARMFRDLNDGRVQTVVKQMIAPNMKSAHALKNKE